MNERSRELISAYLDGELDADEVAELSDAWRRSPELRNVTVRYASVGELMRGARASAGQPPIANRVRERMAEEVAAEAEFSRALAEVDSAVELDIGQRHDVNTVVEQGVDLLLRRFAADAAIGLFAVVDGAGFFGKFITHVLVGLLHRCPYRVEELARGGDLLR